MSHKTTAALILPSSIVLTHDICNEQWQHLTSILPFILFSHSRVCFGHYLLFKHCSEGQHLLLTCELCHGFHYDHIHVCGEHWPPQILTLESNCSTHDYYISSSLSESSNFYFRPVINMLSNTILFLLP